MFKAKSICDNINKSPNRKPDKPKTDEHKDQKTIEDSEKGNSKYFKAAVKAYNKCVDKPPKEYKLLNRPSRD